MSDRFTTYFGALRHLHARIEPARYLEIGVHKGYSLTLAARSTTVVGVDPEPMIEVDLPPTATIHAETSDAWFAGDGATADPFDLAFVDGLHHFEQALRDVINIERHSRPDTVIAIHDCLPVDAVTSSRERTTVLWSGDVWKTMAALRTHRPDLRTLTLDAAPTGLGLVTGLDPRSTALDDAFDEIVATYMPRTFTDCDRAELGVVDATPGAIDSFLGLD